MAPVAFFAASILAIVGAVGVVSLANPFYNVLALVVHLISLAALFLLLRAEFVAAAQIVVYAGAVMVLYVFVVAYVGGQDEPLGGATGGASKGLAYLFAGALLVEICIAVLGSGLKMLHTEGACPPPRWRSPSHSSARRPRPGAAGSGHPLVPRRLGLRLQHRRHRRPDAAQPARDPPLPRAHAQRRQPRAHRLRADVGQRRRPDLRDHRHGRRGLRGDRRARADRRHVSAADPDRRRRGAGAAR